MFEKKPNASLVLIGFQHAGKSTLGALLAQQLVCEFIDTDEAIETYHGQGKTVREIHQEKGEAAFRALETTVIQTIQPAKQVIATGGGSLLDSQNIISLKQHGPLCYLTAPADFLYERDKARPGSRYKNFAEFECAYLARQAIFERVADLRVEISNQTTEALVCQVIALVNAFG